MPRPSLLIAALCTAAFSVVTPSALAKAPKTAAVDSTVPVGSPVQQCAPVLSSLLFSPWGDENLYSPFPGSTFEDGVPGWSWSGGASVIGDDDQVLTVGGTHALQIPGGATAKSAPLCVDSTMPSMRFFIKRLSGTGNLTVSGILAGAKQSDSVVLATVGGTSSWAPSAPVVFPSYLADVVGSGSLSAQFLFTADKGTTFRVDDVAMDPYRRT